MKSLKAEKSKTQTQEPRFHEPRAFRPSLRPPKKPAKIGRGRVAVIVETKDNKQALLRPLKSTLLR